MVIEFENIGGLSPLERVTRSFGLLNAKEAAPGLGRELPKTSKNYNSPFKAHRRLKYIAGLVNTGDYTAEIFRDERRVLGIASRQDNLAFPLRDYAGEKTSEISYWHRKLPTDTALDVGLTVVNRLVDRPVPPDDFSISWMVTLPDDEIKAAVLLAAGMQMVRGPQSFEIGDGVSEPRQLWAKFS